MTTNPKKPLPTVERLRELLRYEPETGKFFWLVDRTQNVKAGSEAGSICGKYVQVGVDNVSIYAHRAAWALHHGAWPANDVDHINGAGRDNRITNLRDVSKDINLQNQRRARRDSGTGLLGASWYEKKGKFLAQIRVKGRTRHLGYFQTAEAAHDAYVKAKRQLHAGCTI